MMATYSAALLAPFPFPRSPLRPVCAVLRRPLVSFFEFLDVEQRLAALRGRRLAGFPLLDQKIAVEFAAILPQAAVKGIAFPLDEIKLDAVGLHVFGEDLLDGEAGVVGVHTLLCGIAGHGVLVGVLGEECHLRWCLLAA